MITIAKDIAQANAITHGGIFHGDEVFATVLLSKILPEVKICRVFRVPAELAEDVIVYDVGGGIYDHHQRDFKECRENGIKYSSFGLLWRQYGMKMLEEVDNREEVFNIFDKTFVSGIDAVDNGQIEKTESINVMNVSNVISTFNPNWDESENADCCFLEAVKFAEKIFERALRRAIANAKAKAGVSKAIEASENGIMILDQFMPWQDHIFTSQNERADEILYVVFPSNRGGYNVNAVPDAPGSFGQRKPLPEEWAGLSGQDLAEATGIKTANFCHPKRFICGADKLEDALLLAEAAIKHQ